MRKRFTVVIFAVISVIGLAGASTPLVRAKVAVLTTPLEMSGQRYMMTAGGIVVESDGVQYVVANLHTMFNPEAIIGAELISENTINLDIETIDVKSDLGKAKATIVWPEKSLRGQSNYRGLDLAILRIARKISSAPFVPRDFIQEEDGELLADTFFFGPAANEMGRNFSPMPVGMSKERGRYWCFPTSLAPIGPGNSGFLLYKLGEGGEIVPKGIFGVVTIDGVDFGTHFAPAGCFISQGSIDWALSEYMKQVRGTK